MATYGKTLYSGDSVREREVIVSRVFDICILVEGNKISDIVNAKK